MLFPNMVLTVIHPGEMPTSSSRARTSHRLAEELNGGTMIDVFVTLQVSFGTKTSGAERPFTDKGF